MLLQSNDVTDGAIMWKCCRKSTPENVMAGTEAYGVCRDGLMQGAGIVHTVKNVRGQPGLDHGTGIIDAEVWQWLPDSGR